MNASSMIRLETPADDTAINDLQMTAFGPGARARAAFRVREQAPHDIMLSFVLTDGLEILASVRQTPIVIGKDRGLLLGPLVVIPQHKGNGFGQALVRQALQSAQAAGEHFVILVGDAPYYGPLGFDQCIGRAVSMPGPVDPDRLLAAEILPGIVGGLSGAVRGLSRD